MTEARRLPGMRLVLLEGLPSPWSQAAKGIFELKKIPYLHARATSDDPPGLLREWTGQDSFPVAAWESEPPRSGWAEILLLAERIAPNPPLIPLDDIDRSLFFGLAHEICGEMGLGWCRRLVAIHEGLRANPTSLFLQHLGRKYGYRSPEVVPPARSRVVSILRQLDSLLDVRQRSGEGFFFFGSQLTALDVYWAAFSNFIEPLPADLCPMPEALRPFFMASDEETRAAFTPTLRSHRDFIFHDHLGLPMDL